MEGLGVHLLKRLWGQEYEDGEKRFQISAHDLQMWAFLRRGTKVSVPRPLLPSGPDPESERNGMESHEGTGKRYLTVI